MRQFQKLDALTIWAAAEQDPSAKCWHSDLAQDR
jgi:hypothetical protein